MKKRLIALIAVCAMLVTAFAGIAGADEAEEKAVEEAVAEAAAEAAVEDAIAEDLAETVAGDGFTVGYNYFGAGSYALLSLANNSDYAIAYMGDTPMGTNDNFQIEQIIADVENMCNAGCDGILI